MRTKMGITIYQPIALFKGWGPPTYYFNLIIGSLSNLQKTFQRMYKCMAQQWHVVWIMLDAAYVNSCPSDLALRYGHVTIILYHIIEAKPKFDIFRCRFLSHFRSQHQNLEIR